jgi:hypothetical protein
MSAFGAASCAHDKDPPLASRYRRSVGASGNSSQCWVRFRSGDCGERNGLKRACRWGEPATASQWPYLNQQFGLFSALAFSQNLFTLPGFDQQRRLFQSLQSAKLPCLSPIIAEGNANDGKFTSNWNISISDNEMAYLDLMITMFVILLS